MIEAWVVSGIVHITYLTYCDCMHCDGHEQERTVTIKPTVVNSDDIDAANAQGEHLADPESSPEEIHEQDILNAAINKYIHTHYITHDIDNWSELEGIGWKEVKVSQCGEDTILRLMGMPSLFDVPGLPSTGAALPSTEVR